MLPQREGGRERVQRVEHGCEGERSTEIRSLSSARMFVGVQVAPLERVEPVQPTRNARLYSLKAFWSVSGIASLGVPSAAILESWYQEEEDAMGMEVSIFWHAQEPPWRVRTLFRKCKGKLESTHTHTKLKTIGQKPSVAFVQSSSLRPHRIGQYSSGGFFLFLPKSAHHTTGTKTERSDEEQGEGLAFGRCSHRIGRFISPPPTARP